MSSGTPTDLKLNHQDHGTFSEDDLQVSNPQWVSSYPLHSPSSHSHASLLCLAHPPDSPSHPLNLDPTHLQTVFGTRPERPTLWICQLSCLYARSSPARDGSPSLLIAYDLSLNQICIPIILGLQNRQFHFRSSVAFLWRRLFEISVYAPLS